MSFHCLLASAVSDEKSAVNILRISAHDVSLSLAAFKILSSLSFNSLNMMYLGVDVFHFILVEVHSASWMGLFFIKFGKLLATIFSNVHSAPFPPLSLGLT